MPRHTFLTTMPDAGCDLRDVQIAARHADPCTTMRHERAPRTSTCTRTHPRRVHGPRHLTAAADARVVRRVLHVGRYLSRVGERSVLQ